jgi:cystathionine beta-synthase
MRIMLTFSRKEGMFVGGSSGSALAGALRYLHTSEGQPIASDPNANVVILFPDGVRNYMSKPWFIENLSSNEGEGLRGQIRDIIGRDLGDVNGVGKHVTENGKVEKGDGHVVEEGLNGLHLGEKGLSNGD